MDLVYNTAIVIAIGTTERNVFLQIFVSGFDAGPCGSPDRASELIDKNI